MRSAIQRGAVFLLAVFTVGGLLSPLAHRVSHVHDVEHRHGQAAANFSVDALRATGADFYVEEQTPPKELSCELCARLALDSFESGQTESNQLSFSTVLSPDDVRPSDRSRRFSRIRAPPVMS